MVAPRARRWCWLIAVVGLCIWIGFGLNLAYELSRIGLMWAPLLTFFLGSGLSLPLVYAGWRIGRESWVDTPAAKRIVAWTVVGAVGALLTQAVVILVVVAEGRLLPKPQLLLLIWLDGGALAGTLFGYSYQRARHDAREAEQARAAVTFINRTLRHECLNGLNIISGRAEQAQTAVDDETARETLETIQSRATGMAEMVDNIRSFGETFEARRTGKRVDLSAALNQRVEHARTEYPDAVIDAVVRENVYAAAGDALNRVFEHLLQNAVEHNDAEPPEVTVTVETSPSTVTVQVADNGPGIPDHDRAALFTPDLERQHRFGLYLVKTLVNYYDGEVEVAETGPTGTVMRVELPRAEPP